MNIYLNCILISLIGLALSTLTVLKSLRRKAKIANIVFDWQLFLKSDLIFQTIGTILTVAMALILLEPFIKEYPKFANSTLRILAGFATIGYVGSDLASRFFSVVNGRLNEAIDYKTTQADKANGTEGSPTPAAKPVNDGDVEIKK